MAGGSFRVFGTISNISVPRLSWSSACCSTELQQTNSKPNEQNTKPQNSPQPSRVGSEKRGHLFFIMTTTDWSRAGPMIYDAAVQHKAWMCP